jgi:hypothetical protein
MCTLSLISNGEVLRLAMNRDELLTRPPALPPRLVRVGDRSAIMPIDPQSGGTWIAVNDAGLALTVLNVNPAPPPAACGFAHSRGEIIQRLLHCDNLQHAWSLAEQIDRDSFPPFRLVIADTAQCVVLSPDDTDVFDVADLPLMFTSSGLGDALVEPPRRRLFLDALPRTPAAQDEFHRHRWPDRPELSVCMSRAGAATVSYTVIEIDAARVSLKYLDRAPTLSQHRYEQYHFHSCAVPRAPFAARVGAG